MKLTDALAVMLVIFIACVIAFLPAVLLFAVSVRAGLGAFFVEVGALYIARAFIRLIEKEDK